MATIKFLPVCSSCGKIIIDKIDVTKKTMTVSDGMPFTFGHCGICPSVCCNCGAPFDSAEMPNKLPFDNSDFAHDLAQEAVERYFETHSRPMMLSYVRGQEDVILAAVNAEVRKKILGGEYGN